MSNLAISNDQFEAQVLYCYTRTYLSPHNVEFEKEIVTVFSAESDQQAHSKAAELDKEAAELGFTILPISLDRGHLKTIKVTSHHRSVKFIVDGKVMPTT